MPALIAVDDSLGAVLIALILSSILYGVICHQVYYYYVENSEGDRFFLRGLVGILIVLETLQLILISHAIYHYVVKDFGNYLDLSQTIWSYHLQVGIVDIVELLIQGFFAWRIYILSNGINWLLPIAIVSCSIATMITGITFVVKGLRDRYFSRSQNLVPWASASLSTSMAADVLITAGMMYYLSKGKVHYFEGTRRGVHTLMIYSVNTGLITTIFNILSLATFVSYKTTMIYTPLFCTMARLYACTFLSTLNSRKTVRAHFNGMGKPGLPKHEAYTLSELGTENTGSASHVRPVVSLFAGQNSQVYVPGSKEVLDM